MQKPRQNIFWDQNQHAWLVTGFKAIEYILKSPNFSAAAASDANTTVPTGPDPSACRQHVASSLKNHLVWCEKKMKKTAGNNIQLVKNRAQFDLQCDLITPWCHELAFQLTGTSNSSFIDHAKAIFHMGESGQRKKGEDATLAIALEVLPLIEQRRLAPTEDLISLLARGKYAPSLLLSPIIQLFVGLTTTLPLLLGNIFYELYGHQDRSRIFPLEKEKLAEIFRICGPVQVINRVATVATEVEGNQIKRGDRVKLFLVQGNRDAGQFSNPLELNLHREETDFLSFGKGIHACLGYPLVELTCKYFIEFILKNFPNLLIDIDRVEVGGSNTIRGITVLPVSIN